MRKNMDYESLKSLFIDRVSIREYSTKGVNNSLVTKIIEATKYAPSSCNRQSIKVKIIKKDEETFDILSKANYGGSGFAKSAAALVLVLVDTRSYFMPMEMNFPINDGSIFATYFMLIAKTLGLDTCWVSWQASFKQKKKIYDELNIEQYYLPICVLTLGYREGKVIESPREDADYYILSNTSEKTE